MEGHYFQMVSLGKALAISQPQFVVGETEMMVLSSVNCFKNCG